MAKTRRPPRITGLVRSGGQLYGRGAEKELAARITPAEAERLIRKGAIAGDWSGLVQCAEPEAAALEAEPAAAVEEEAKPKYRPRRPRKAPQ